MILKAQKKLALNTRAERLSRSIARDYQIPFFTDRGKTEVRFVQLKKRGSTGFGLERPIVCRDLQSGNCFVAQQFLRHPTQSNMYFFPLLFSISILTVQ